MAHNHLHIAIVGAKGQLGKAMLEAFSSTEHIVYSYTSRELNICDVASINTMHEHPLDVLINCAAYTNVPQAEEDVEAALRVNETGAAKLAEYCKTRDALLIHFSTDYVFDGKQQHPYRENDETNPLNKYGYSKWRGEKRIADSGCDFLTLRVSWLVSRYPKNFLTFMLGKLRQNEDVKVVDDQFASPTSAHCLADDLVHMFDRLDLSTIRQKSGLYHYTHTGETTWYGLVLLLQKHTQTESKVEDVSTSAFPSPVERPHYSKLDSSLFYRSFSLQSKDWQEAMTAILERIAQATP